MNNAMNRLRHCFAVTIMVLCVGLAAVADTDTNAQAIKDLIATYAMSIDRADTKVA